MPKYRDPLNNLELQLVPLEMIEFWYNTWEDGDVWEKCSGIPSVYKWDDSQVRTWLVTGRMPEGSLDTFLKERRLRIRIED